MKWHVVARMAAAILAAGLSAAGQTATTGQTTTATATSTQASQPAASQPVWRQLWAYRAARAQAACGLAEKVRTQSLPDDIFVADWLDETDLALEAALLPVAEDAKVVRGQDGMCEVTLQLPPQKLRAALNAICRRQIQAYRDELSVPEGAAVLRCTAKAAAPAALAGGEMIAVEPGRDPFDRADPDAHKFWQENVSDAGRDQAEAAAWADAAGRLARRIGEMPIDADVTLAKYVRSVGGEVDMEQFLVASRREHMWYHPAAAVVAVEMEVSRRTVWACVKAWLHARGDAEPAEIRRMEELIVAAGGKSIRQLGLGWGQKQHLLKDAPDLQAVAALASLAPNWLAGPLRYTGTAPIVAAPTELEAQARAAGAAAIDGRIALAELVGGLDVPGVGKTSELAGRSRAARVAVLTILQGARPVVRPKFTKDGSAEVTLSLPADLLWRLVFSWQLEPLISSQ